MQVLLSVTVMVVDLSVAIMHVTVSVAIFELEVSAALMQVIVFASNMWVTIFIVFMQVGVYNMAGFRWFQVVSGWFQVIPRFSKYLQKDAMSRFGENMLVSYYMLASNSLLFQFLFYFTQKFSPLQNP